MILNHKKNLFLAALGLTLAALICIEARGVVEENTHVIKVDGEHVLVKRAPGDPGDDGSMPPPRPKKKKKRVSMAADGAGGVTTSTTMVPAASSSKASTTKASASTTKPSAEEDPDEAALMQQLKEQGEEKMLIEKVVSSIKAWVAWLEAHNKKTNNMNRARQLDVYFGKVSRRYIYRQPKKHMLMDPYQHIRHNRGRGDMALSGRDMSLRDSYNPLI